MSTNNKWGALSMRDRAFLIREAVRNGITDINSIRDLYNQNGERIRLGTPYRTFEAGSDYDYFNAAPENMPQESDGHWTSRNPHTGQILKSKDHPTYYKTVQGEKDAGYEIIQVGDREYSFPNEHRFDDESKQPTEDEYIAQKAKGRPYTTDSNNEKDSSFIEKLAYSIGSVPSAKDAGEGDFGDILEGVFNAITNRDPYKYDDLKAFLGHPEDYGFKPSSDTRGPQFGDVISKYKNKNIKTYQGDINPFNEYVVTQEDYNKFFDMATKGEIFYSNADGEYLDYYYKGNPDNMLDKDTAHFLHTPYRNDSHDYPIEFVIKDGNLYANAADFYDFSANKGDGLKKRIQARLLTRYGKPYIVRQNMIPVRAIYLPEEFLGLPTLDYKGNSSNMDLTEEQKRARNMHRNLELFELEK